MNYKTATKFELNKALFPASRDYLKCEDVMEKKNPARSGFMWGDGVNWFEFNPCQNWNDIMPIAVELGVYIEAYGEYSKANRVDGGGFPQEITRSTTPQRALVICCIKVLEANNEQTKK